MKGPSVSYYSTAHWGCTEDRTYLQIREVFLCHPVNVTVGEWLPLAAV